ncbi:hypothetical protein DPMN_014874 [Dreissena polymorpha]|uniref:Uncharacterized protein n=1 Tax=Dreissena polymorpha TaxID=45954 RepID=A0A9D4NAJ3_DREPO|nr:hypothetical protein DPMN_014874 [Dreissena polymorpha]
MYLENAYMLSALLAIDVLDVPAQPDGLPDDGVLRLEQTFLHFRLRHYSNEQHRT